MYLNLHVILGIYSGTAGDGGDGLSKHNNRPFSTTDRNNNRFLDCADFKKSGGGWWYDDNCFGKVNLNGDLTNTCQRCIYWYEWKRYTQLKPNTIMKFRPIDF